MRAATLLLGAATVFLVMTGAVALAQQAADAKAPESGSGVEAKEIVHAKRHMVVAANPLAAQAGLDMLRDGGTAADAMVAVQTVLGLVEPQSSGLGGGAFLVWYDAATGKLTTLDGRETAPAAATPKLFIDIDGKPLDFMVAVVGGRSVGTPGVPRLLETLHRKFGKLPWASLFDAGVKHASDGFVVSPRLATLIAEDVGYLDSEAATKSYFFDTSGAPLNSGALLKNPEYAASLKALAEGGADAFYRGPIAEKIVAAVTGHGNAGGLSLADMQGYAVKERDAVCASYRGLDVCGMGPPSSGALTIGQILGMIEPFDLARLGPEDPESWRIIGDATRLAFADRERYLGDADFIDIPKGMLDGQYLKTRSALLRRPTALAKDEVTAGEPPRDKAELRIDGISAEIPATSHISIVDDAGNVAVMTTSIEGAFGSRLFVGGFLLNNQLTDFSFEPEQGGQAVANRIEPGKRPRSSMAPTIVLKDGKPIYALGSPGGSNIIPYVATTLVGLIDWKMDIQQAITMPHLSNRFGTYNVEMGTSAESLTKDLEALGYTVKPGELNSGLHGIALGKGELSGGADPRREGVALGD